MNKLIVRVGLFGLVAATAMGLGGCNNNLKDENAKLRDDNTKLATENEDNKNKLLESESKRGEAENKAAQSQAQLVTAQNQLAEKNNNPGPNYPNDGNTGGKPRGPKGGGGSGEKDVTLVVAGDVLFSPGSATLTAGGKKEIDTVISTLKSKYSGHTIRVEGYTDSDPITKAKDKFPTNKALSQARAEAVEKYMSTKGISASRISAVGMGASKPKETKAASRRVEIVVVGNGN